RRSLRVNARNGSSTDVCKSIKGKGVDITSLAAVTLNDDDDHIRSGQTGIHQAGPSTNNRLRNMRTSHTMRHSPNVVNRQLIGAAPAVVAGPSTSNNRHTQPSSTRELTEEDAVGGKEGDERKRSL